MSVKTTSKAPTFDADTMVAAYADAAGAAKVKIRRGAEADLASAIRDKRWADAETIQGALDRMVTVTEKKVVDHAKIAADKAYALLMAGHAILSGIVTPDGMPEGFDFTKSDLAVADDDLYKIMQVVGAHADNLRDAAHKIAGARVVTGTKAPKRDVRAHIESATTGHTGFMSVSAIAKHTSDTYGEDHPSTGAVWARLSAENFPGTVAGVTTFRKGATLPDGTTAPSDGVFVG